MASPLVQRYAYLCQMPLEEVEKVWRQVKVQANREGYKNNWEKVVENFRDELGLEKEEGRLVYFDGAEAEIISESPSFALIRVHDIDQAPESLREFLETSKGLIVVNFEHLTEDAEGKKPIGYPYERGKKNETTGSVGVASGGAGSTPPAPSVVYKGEDYDLTDVKGKKATIKNKKSGKKKKVALKEIFDVGDFVEDLREMWKGINPNLSQKQKEAAIGLILEAEGVPDLPPSTLRNLGNTGNNSNNHGVENSDDFSIDDSDWGIVLSEPAEDSDVEKELPGLPPVEPRENSPEPDTKAGPPDEDEEFPEEEEEPEEESPGRGRERKPEPKPGDDDEEEPEETEIRKPDSEELQNMLRKVRAPKSGFNLKKAADDTEKAAMESVLPNGKKAVIIEDKPLVAQPDDVKKAIREQQFSTWDSILGVD